MRPADAGDLVTLLRHLPLDAPLTVIGAASNLIVRDGGVPGVVVRLARGFGAVRPSGTASSRAPRRWTPRWPSTRRRPA